MFKEIRDLKPASVSIFVLGLVASWLFSLSLGMTIVGAQASKTDAGQQFSAVGGLQIALTTLAVLMCLPSVVKVAIRRDSRRIALWQVIGASPRSARARYLSIVAFSALAGSAVGGFLAFLSWPSFGKVIAYTGFLMLPALSDPLTVWAWTFGPGTAFIVLILALLLGTRQLNKIEPVEAVAETPEPVPSRRVGRAIFSIIIVFGMIASYIAIAATPKIQDPQKLSGLLSSYWGTALGLLIAYGISDRAIVRPVVQLVGHLIPLANLDSWVIARTSARRRATLSTSVITPLVVAAASVGSVFGMVNQTKNVTIALGAKEADLQVSPTSQIVLIFSAPVVIAAFSGVIAVYLTNRWRKHDIALLGALGASASSIRWSAVFECLIYFVSAVLISTLILGINAAAIGAALGHGPVPKAGPVWVGNETYYLLIAGFSLLAFSIVIPTFHETKTIDMAAIVQ